MNRITRGAFLLGLAAAAFAQTDAALSNGVTYKVPEGWRATQAGGEVALKAPEGDLTVYLVVPAGGDPESSIRSAWQKASPAMAWKVLNKYEGPGRDGWDGRVSLDYDVPPNEKKVVAAIALQSRQPVVVLVEGNQATVEKRSSQLSLMMASLRPPGQTVESFAGKKASKMTPERIAELKGFVEEGMKLAGVPGAAIAIIEDGKIVFEGGLGVKEVGKTEPVDANTLFMAASNTKGMTTLLLSILADQKKLTWDQPVRSLYPAFRLGDEETTKQVQVRHLVCACTGMPRQDFEWLFEFQGHTAKSSLDMLGTMKPTSKFGELFQYSNLMVSAAGYTAAHLANPGKEPGAAYDAAMDKFVFQPVGMKSTTFSMSQAQAGNHARPHADSFSGATTVVPMTMNHSVVPHRPAGGVWTSAHDLARYVLLELNKGVIDGKRVVSEANLLERRKPQISTGEKSYYAMGLSVTNRNGVEVVRHGGSLFGYKSDLVFLPESGVGAVILTNSDNGGFLLGPFARKLQEILFDARPEAKQNLAFSIQNYQKGLAKQRELYRLPAEPSSYVGLAGKYRDAALGALIVREEGGNLLFDLGEWTSPMASRKNPDGTTSYLVAMPELLGLEFVRGGTKESPTLVIRDAQHEYVFSRQ
jgi:CubicO group peptidase (beta-lactamase class C family)